jgi:hypothetical protein
MATKKYKKIIEEAQAVNLDMESMLITKYRNLSSSRFIYTGFEELGIKNGFLENKLFSSGKLCFAKYKNLFGLFKMSQGNLNWYGEPIDYNAISLNGEVSISRTIANSVPIYDNEERTSILSILAPIIKEMSNAKIAERYNINNIKIPFVASGTEAQKADIILYEEQRNIGVPFMFFIDDTKGKGKAFAEPLNIQELQVQCYLPQLQDYLQNQHNNILSLLGINFSPNDKAERSLLTEVDSNDDEINSILRKALTFREKAIDKINTMFGTELTVKLFKKVDAKEEAKIIKTEEPKEVINE